MANQLIHIDNAVLCLDCERIGTNASECAGCGSSALLHLSRVLNRTEERKEVA